MFWGRMAAMPAVPDIVSVGGLMRPRSGHAWRFSLFRRRKRAKSVASVSDFVLSTDRCEPNRAETPRVVVTPVRQPSNDGLSHLSPAARASRAQQLEAENRRLREMIGDLMLETEILRAALRRNSPDAATPHVSVRAYP